MQWLHTSRRSLLLHSVAVLLVAAIAGCSSSSSGNQGAAGPSGAASPAPAQLLEIATQSDAVTLDPPSQADIPSQMVGLHIFDTLVTRNAKGDIVASLAESWSWSPDGKELTFKLRKGVKFHDGSAFNAAVVKANFDRILDEKNALRARGGFTGTKAIEAVDEQTVKFVLTEPNGALLARFASPTSGIISKQALEKYSKDDLARNPVGTGPFIFVEWKPKEHIALKANHDFWGGKPKLEQLLFRPVPEDSTRVNMLESGQVQVAAPVGVQYLSQLKDKPGIKAAAVPGMDNLIMPLNTKKKALQDPRVRQAINYAIDREALVKTLYRGYAEPLEHSPLAPAMWGYADVGTYYKYDPAKAKALLKDAGYEKGLTLNFWVPDGRYIQDAAVAEALVGFLSEVGIQAKVNKYEWGTYVDKILAVKTKPEEEWDALMISFAVGSQDADEGFAPLVGCGQTPAAGGFNFSDYCNQGVDQALADGRRNTEPAKRLEAYARAEKQVMADAPWLFLVAYQYTAAQADSVQGLELLPLGAVSARNASVGK